MTKEDAIAILSSEGSVKSGHWIWGRNWRSCYGIENCCASHKGELTTVEDVVKDIELHTSWDSVTNYNISLEMQLL